MEGIGESKKPPIGTEGGSQVLAEVFGPVPRPIPHWGRHYAHLPAFGEINRRYGKTAPCASGDRVVWMTPGYPDR